MARPDFGMERNIIPLTAPVDSAGTAFSTAWVKVTQSQWITFFDWAGVVTAASADQPILVTVWAATGAATTGEVAIPYKYRKSGVAGSNTWTAPASATASGTSFGTTEDGTILQIDIDPASLDSLLADAAYLRLTQGIDAGGTVTLNAIWAELTPRYAQATAISAT